MKAIPPAARRRRVPELHRVTVMCVCCGGSGAALVSVLPWGTMNAICVRCNVGGCSRNVTNAPVGSPGWGCSDRVNLPVKPHLGGRRWS